MLYLTTACPIGKSLVRRVAQDELLTVMQGIRKNTAQQYILDGTGCYRFKAERDVCRKSIKLYENTILRTIHRSGRLVNTPMKAAPRLQQRHKNQRLQFARSNMATDWNKIIFSDEKKFNLDGPDGYAHYWRDLRKDPMYISKRNFGGGSLMVWAAFCGNGTVALSFIETRTNSQDYQQLLAQHLLPYLRRRRRANMIYQQDNASVHASNSTLAWFAANNVVLLDWPAVYANAKQYTTVNDLKKSDSCRVGWYDVSNHYFFVDTIAQITDSLFLWSRRDSFDLAALLIDQICTFLENVPKIERREYFHGRDLVVNAMRLFFMLDNVGFDLEDADVRRNLGINLHRFFKASRRFRFPLIRSVWLDNFLEKPELLLLFAEAGADINEKDEYGRTALTSLLSQAYQFPPTDTQDPSNGPWSCPYRDPSGVPKTVFFRYWTTVGRLLSLGSRIFVRDWNEDRVFDTLQKEQEKLDFDKRIIVGNFITLKDMCAGVVEKVFPAEFLRKCLPQNLIGFLLVENDFDECF
ncbi:unnamed protein product [Caenorhabditis auriculariae]|uniref:Tc1-like transposase DDE domain-containing protein n=1 Tax=Caenorhabditis auriculariae TaxID=2777116 RepID=A0A8S1H1A3_9PELO|nr:unnamed protein product [Caenorhabditis auriculariae]